MNLSKLPTYQLQYHVAAIVAHIPGVNGNVGSVGGMMADYNILATFLTRQTPKGSQKALNSFNHIWLATSDDTRSLASVRAALSRQPLALGNLYDRRAIIEDLQSDPLYVNILVILSIGGISVFLLALVGNLIASWLSVRMRRDSFVVLRALGATSRQVAGMLLWEQGLVYLGAILLGLGFGVILTKVAVPILVFTGQARQGPMSALGISDFYLLQHVIPTQIVIPLSLELILAALVLICVLALLTMLRTALSPSISDELRLNED